jgi:hypothetical protein
MTTPTSVPEPAAPGAFLTESAPDYAIPENPLMPIAAQ